MNEYMRQAYLSSLGVENYMPRLRLPIAPESVACILPALKINDLPVSAESSHVHVKLYSPVQHDVVHSSGFNPVSISEVLRDLSEQQKPTPIPIVPSNSSQQSERLKTIAPFSLSIWRPTSGLLIIDERNTHMALPTELLLRNILSALFGVSTAAGREEVLGWPLVENHLLSRTEEDARNALQVWLEVEMEQRPTKHVLLFGEKAARYFLSNDFHYEQSLWQWLHMSPSVQGMIAPSLVQLLQQPVLKRKLWQSLMPLRAPL